MIGSAPRLVSQHRQERPDIVLVENGVEPGRFRDKHVLPSALKIYHEPIVGYHGAVARWFDFDLLGSVAERLPEFQFVIIGPVDRDSEESLAKLNRQPNVHHVDAVPSDEIPDFVLEFGVGIIPFVVNDLTRAVSPLKMYEYFAARVPVVATALPVCVDHLLVHTASTADGFAVAIEAAFKERDTATFITAADVAADEASWDRRIDAVRQRLREQDQLRVPSR